MSTEDVHNFELLCQQESAAQWSLMEQHMARQGQFSHQQIGFIHEEYKAESERYAAFCRNEVFGVREEARQHQQHWVSEVNSHQAMLRDVQAGLLQELSLIHI